MESPDTWNLLTSSLAASNLEEPREAWAFLVVQGLVHDQPGDRQQFVAAVARVQAEGPITGPSEPLRIAMQIAALSCPIAQTPDPGGQIAAARRETLRSWRE